MMVCLLLDVIVADKANFEKRTSANAGDYSDTPSLVSRRVDTGVSIQCGLGILPKRNTRDHSARVGGVAPARDGLSDS